MVIIGNYVAGLAVVVTLGLISRTAEGRETVVAKLALTTLALIAAGWGFVECHYTVRVLDDVNVIRDEAMPVGKRLTELAKDDPDPHRSVVLHLGIAEADDLPTIAHRRSYGRGISMYSPVLRGMRTRNGISSSFITKASAQISLPTV